MSDIAIPNNSPLMKDNQAIPANEKPTDDSTPPDCLKPAKRSQICAADLEDADLKELLLPAWKFTPPMVECGTSAPNANIQTKISASKLTEAPKSNIVSTIKTAKERTAVVETASSADCQGIEPPATHEGQMKRSVSGQPDNSAADSGRLRFEVTENKSMRSPPQPFEKSRDPLEKLSGRYLTTTSEPAIPQKLPLRIANNYEPPVPVSSPYTTFTRWIHDLHRIQFIDNHSYNAWANRGMSDRYRWVFGSLQKHPWISLLISALICVISIRIILMLLVPPQPFISPINLGNQAGNKSGIPVTEKIPPGEHSIRSTPTISAEGIDAVLAQYRSPATGTGQTWIEMGKRYGINPAYALAFFIHESTAGTNPGWAGLKAGGTTHNIGNIICAGYTTCYAGFRDYPSWEDGIEDWYKLIAHEYVEGRGLSTVEQILPIYCPANDGCLPKEYISIVNTLVDQWRQDNLHKK